MQELNIKETRVFRQVASVIGEEQAEIELIKASESWTDRDIESIEVGLDLTRSFIWTDTVQGKDFWSAIASEMVG
ncbi:hypothetical protein KUA24_81 [Vibrio phage HNL01]|nr:hypothetical protein KUA24_81 [Vibrio phage HNL01]